MTAQHREYASGKWNDLSLMEQLANTGSEIERTISWKKKGNIEYSRLAFNRALELLNLTILDEKNKKRLKELTRTREALVDHFLCDNTYNTTEDQWRNYFAGFTYAVRANK